MENQREQLLELRKQVAQLNDEEKKLRELYLQQLAKGEIQGPPTGFSSIDRPGFQFMQPEDIMNVPETKNIYQELYDNNKDHMHQVALMYFGTKITFKTFFANIDKTAQALVANGVKRGDFVTICSGLTPEVLYTFYALAKIGAVANMMSPFFDKDQMVERIGECNSKMAIVMDKFYEPMHDTFKKAGIEKLVVLPSLNSSILGLAAKKPKIDEANNETYWNGFVKEGKNTPVPETVAYEEQMPMALVYSSGSTGASKGILLTHDSFENSVHAYPRCAVKINRGDIYYQIIPPWFSTGISTSAHLPLSYGGTLFMDPRFDKKVFVGNNLKLNPAGTIASISLFQGFLDEELLKKGSLSNLNVTFQGGEKMQMKDKIAIEEVFRKYNSNARLMNGYGQCECGAGITTQTMNTPSNTSVGIPIPGVRVGIFDENNNEVDYDVRGEIYVDTPCGMKEYYSNPKATKEYFYYDEAGVKWSKTGDIGVIHPNGELEVLGRAIDYSVINGKKLFNFDIEDSILKLDFVQNCDVITNNNGELAAHIILRSGFENGDLNQYCRAIQEIIYEDNADLDYVPCNFKFRKEFPIKQFSKRDTAAMASETEGFIFMDKNYLNENRKLV